ncbi:MAG: UpxY family transcription antiterminator [Prevotella sp.]|nr:UpxY family transcription antiterminator [Prevotella sp.]
MENSWLVIRTFNRREMEVGAFLKEKGLTYFIPMTYKEKVVSNELKPRRVLVPVVHNYVFLQKPDEGSDIRNILTECRVPLQLMKNKGDDKVSEISNKEMTDFRLLCDPDYVKTPLEFLDAEEAETKPGREVEVIHGQFAGIHGKLYKSGKKYWFIKTVGGVSVMLRISRWYCKPV